MRILIISKALIVGQYQTKAEALARKPGVELTVVVPPKWQDERGVMQLEKEHVHGYQFIVAKVALNGHYHLHFFPSIARIIGQVRPEIVHIDEEPYNFATFHALVMTRRQFPQARTLFFTWQNISHRYPPPFSLMEGYVHDKIDYALAGNLSAGHVLREKGFTKPIHVVPQFGIDPDIFCPGPLKNPQSRFVVGFAARLVPEKGGSLLLSALRRLGVKWELRIVGSGPDRAKLEKSARQLGIADSVRFLPWQTSDQMPDFFRSLDVLVAPSMSRANWTEQFGRVLVEAMACGVPVIGSSSGEIPNVIGEAGIVFPEGDAQGLTSALRMLIDDRRLLQDMGRRGRERVLERFTQSRIADETFAAYSELMR
jgi:glycosyltransferase involved in cell wall biosynthesis